MNSHRGRYISLFLFSVACLTLVMTAKAKDNLQCLHLDYCAEDTPCSPEVGYLEDGFGGQFNYYSRDQARYQQIGSCDDGGSGCDFRRYLCGFDYYYSESECEGASVGLPIYANGCVPVP